MNMPGKTRRGQRGEKIEFNMTPMIDIVFNLIIFFMLMPSFEAKEGYLPTNLPSTTGVQDKQRIDENSIRIDLQHVEPYEDVANRKECIIFINRDEIKDNAALRQRLREARDRIMGSGGEKAMETLKKVPVTISPDMVIWQKHVVAAFDAAIDAGFVNIRFTVPQ